MKRIYKQQEPYTVRDNYMIDALQTDKREQTHTAHTDHLFIFSMAVTGGVP